MSLEFTVSLAIHNYYMRTGNLVIFELYSFFTSLTARLRISIKWLWTIENSCKCTRYNIVILMYEIRKQFIPLRIAAQQAIKQKDAKEFYNCFFNAWNILENLQLPGDKHAFATPKAFFMNKEQERLISDSMHGIFIKELRNDTFNRYCKALIGPKATGKSTIVKTCCAITALLCTK